MACEGERGEAGLILLVEPDSFEAGRARQMIAGQGYRVRHFASPAELLAAAKLTEACCLLLNLHSPGLPNGRELLSLLLRRGNVPPIILGLATADPVPLPRGMATLRLPYQEMELRQALTLSTASGRLPDGAALGEPLTAPRALTRREREVLDAVTSGHSNKRIAAELGISVRTAEVHRARLMAKLGARNLVELLRQAAAAGLLP